MSRAEELAMIAAFTPIVCPPRYCAPTKQAELPRKEERRRMALMPRPADSLSWFQGKARERQQRNG